MIFINQQKIAGYKINNIHFQERKNYLPRRRSFYFWTRKPSSTKKDPKISKNNFLTLSSTTQVLSKSWFHSPSHPPGKFISYFTRINTMHHEISFFLIKRCSAPGSATLHCVTEHYHNFLDDHITNQCTCKMDPVTKLVSKKMVKF